MRYVSIMVFMLMLFSMAACASQTYLSEYLADGWLKVTRTITVNDMAGCTGSAITGSCSDTGAAPPSAYVSGPNAGFSTRVVLAITNIGPVERSGIDLAESLSHVPNGANVVYSPTPLLDGRLATWHIPSLRSNESLNVSYSYSAAAREGQINRIPSVMVTAEPASAVLSATEKGEVGSRIILKLSSISGMAMPGVGVRVNYPDGSSQLVATDKSGTASFIAGNEGFYTYTVEGYSVVSLASTEVKARPMPPIAAAAVADPGMLSFMFSLLPMLAGIFAVAIVMLVVYSFFSAKREDESSYAPPAKQAQAASPVVASGDTQSKMSYSQNFSFAEAAKEEQKIEDMTRSLVESRKRQLRTEETLEGESGEIISEGEAEFADSVQEATAKEGEEEATEREDGIDSELAKLEAQASQSGETVSEEDEIEKAIAELESIRAQLRERKEKVHGESAGEQPESGMENAESAYDSGDLEGEKTSETAVSEDPSGDSLEDEEEREGDAPEEEAQNKETALARLVKKAKMKNPRRDLSGVERENFTTIKTKARGKETIARSPKTPSKKPKGRPVGKR